MQFLPVRRELGIGVAVFLLAQVARPGVLNFAGGLPADENLPLAELQECLDAVLVRDGLKALEMPAYVKTSGSKGLHVYVPMKRGPVQKDVWTFTKAFAMALAQHYPKILTAEYRVAKRPRGRVLVDYNQNAWGRTLASVYSVRPTPVASVSTPVTWREIERGIEPHQFTMDVVLRRVSRQGDLFAPVMSGKVTLPAL